MINYLKDCQKTTLIGQLPDIINSNNESIRNEFNQMYDSSLNRLTKSVYAPTGSVKSHFGEFVNLACEYITIKNVDSLQNSIFESVNQIMSGMNHNSIGARFTDSEFIDTNFMHDADSIVYEKISDNDYISVKQQLDMLSNKLNIIKDAIKEANDNNISILLNVKMLINDLYYATNDDELVNIVKTAQNNKDDYMSDDDYTVDLLNADNIDEILAIAKIINNRTLKNKISKATTDFEKITIVKKAQKNINKFSLDDSFISALLNASNEREILSVITNYDYNGHIYNSSSNTSIY